MHDADHFRPWLTVARWRMAWLLICGACGLTLCGLVFAQPANPVATASMAASAAAALASEAKPYVSVLKPYADDVGAVFSVGTSLLLAAAFIFAAVLVRREWRRNPLIIEPFDVPKDLQESGLNGTVLSQHLFDALLDLQRQARTDDGHADTSFVELPRLQVDLQLPGMSWSVRSAIRYFKHALGRSERRLVGEAFCVGRDEAPAPTDGERGAEALPRGRSVHAVRVRSSEGLSADVPVRFHDGADLAAAMRSAAEVALPLTNPLEAASIFFSIENPRVGYARTLAAAQLHLRTAPTSLHQDAYVLWASVLRNTGDMLGMQAKLELARTADVDPQSGTETGRLLPRYLNFTGGLHREQRRFGEAEQAFKAALRHEPGNIAAINNLGLLALDREQLSAATVYFRRVIRLNPQSSRGYRGLGLVAQRDGDLGTARRYLARAVDLAPLARWPRVNHIDVLTRLGELQAAEACADELLAFDPAFAPQYRFRSRLALERGNPGAAWRWALKACETDPADAWTYVDRARAALALGRFEDAASDGAQAVRLRPAIADGYRIEAAALAQQNRLPEALARMEQAIAVAPQDLWSFIDRAELQRRAGDDAAAWQSLAAIAHMRPLDADVRRRQAAFDVAEGRLEAAERRLSANTRARPHDFVSWIDLAEVLRRQRRFDEAAAAASQAQALPNQPARPLQKMALIAADQHRPGEAEAHLRQAMQAQPADALAVADLADLLLRQERLHEAASLCAQGLLRGSQQGLLRRRWAHALRELGDWPAARAQLAAAIAEAPHDPDLQLEMADLCLGRHLPEALGFVQKAISLRPSAPQGMTALARVLADRGDIDGAAAALANATALQPGADWVMMTRFDALWRWGRRAEAMAVAEDLLRLRPPGVQALMKIGAGKLVLGDDRAALDSLEQAIALAAPFDNGPRLALAQLLLDSHDDSLADASFNVAESVLERDPGALAALRLMATARVVQNDLEAAIALRRRAAELAPFEVEDLLRLAQLYTDAGRPSQAAQAFEEALVRRPASLQVRRERLRWLLRPNRPAGADPWAEARAEVAVLCRLAPAQTRDLLDWAAALRKENDPALRAEAGAALQAAWVRQPGSVNVQLHLADWLIDQGRKAEALALLQLLAPTVPSFDAETLIQLADKLSTLGDTAAAIGMARRATELRPSDYWTGSRAADVFIAASQWQAAIDLLRSALGLQPNNNWAEIRLARALHAAGDLAGARAACQNLLARAPGDLSAQALLAKLPP